MPRIKRAVPLLVIVDMQWQFPASRDKKVISSIEKQIDYFMCNDFPILFLEYKGYGRTLDCLRERVKDYRHKRYILKNFDNGGPEVWNYLDKHSLRVSEFVICGVNANACVCRTLDYILMLVDGDPGIRITIPKNATRSLYDRSISPLKGVVSRYQCNVNFV